MVPDATIDEKLLALIRAADADWISPCEASELVGCTTHHAARFYASLVAYGEAETKTLGQKAHYRLKR